MTKGTLIHVDSDFDGAARSAAAPAHGLGAEQRGAARAAGDGRGADRRRTIQRSRSCSTTCPSVCGRSSRRRERAARWRCRARRAPGIEAVLASAIEPGDGVLVGVYGHFGELLCTLAARHGAVVERVDAEWGAPVDPEDDCSARARSCRPSWWRSCTPIPRPASCSRSRRSARRAARRARCAGRRRAESGRLRGRRRRLAHRRGGRRLAEVPGRAARGWRCSRTSDALRGRRSHASRVSRDSAYLDLARLRRTLGRRRGREAAAMSTPMLWPRARRCGMVAGRRPRGALGAAPRRRVGAAGRPGRRWDSSVFGDRASTRCR